MALSKYLVEVIVTSFQMLFQACVDVGAKPNKDYNINFDGVGWLQYSTKNGLRCSTSSTYLKIAKKNKNLKIITNAG